MSRQITFRYLLLGAFLFAGAPVHSETVEAAFQKWLQLRHLGSSPHNNRGQKCADALSGVVRAAESAAPVINELERQIFGHQYVVSQDTRTEFQQFERADLTGALNLSCPIFSKLDRIESGQVHLSSLKSADKVQTLAVQVMEARSRIRALSFHQVLQALTERERSGRGLRLSPDIYGDGCDRTLFRLLMDKFVFEPSPQNKVEILHAIARQKLIVLPRLIARKAIRLDEVADVLHVLQLPVASVPDPHRMDGEILAVFREFLATNPQPTQVIGMTQAIGLNIIALPQLIVDLRAYAESRPEILNDVTIQHLLNP